MELIKLDQKRINPIELIDYFDWNLDYDVITMTNIIISDGKNVGKQQEGNVACRSRRIFTA